MSSNPDNSFQQRIHDTNESGDDDDVTTDKECHLDREFGGGATVDWYAFKEAREKDEPYHKGGKPPSQIEAMADVIASYTNHLEDILGGVRGTDEKQLNAFLVFVKALVTETYDTNAASSVSLQCKITEFLRKTLPAMKARSDEERIRSSTIADAVVKICGLVHTDNELQEQ
jgi:hypothetical protein